MALSSISASTEPACTALHRIVSLTSWLAPGSADRAAPPRRQREPHPRSPLVGGVPRRAPSVLGGGRVRPSAAPCPRAPPLISATFPSSFPISVSLFGRPLSAGAPGA